MNTEDRKKMMHKLMEETMADCKILYCQKDLPMTKTCMCWGWECGEGWYDVLRRLSCDLEVLNLLYYDKYKVRIQADQVKEKYGTLHFYYSVVCDNYTPAGVEANKVIDKFESLKDHGYFHIETVIDEKGYASDEVKEDGVHYKLWHPPKTHTVVTQHKDEYDQLKFEAEAAYDILAKNGRYDITPEQRIVIESLENRAAKLVKEAEDECYCTCEDCGCQIGTDWSPRCETIGWITYICDACAEERKNSRYLKNGELWSEKTRLKTKEEVEEDRRKIEEKYR